ncbi:zinc-binding alcohol dehydrogenase [Candidatus Poribacteria bacterium]|nr:zinc-binding alcohol dehydrogenase [Candidatus Poribacteria bacterium]
MPIAHRIVFPQRMRATVEPFEFDDRPGDDEIILETLVSAISSGTELASFTNDQDIGHWKGEPYPVHPGYAAVGRIAAVGSNVKEWRVGDVVFSSVGHASHHRVNPARAPVVRVPDGVDPADAVYVRFCAVSMTTLRTTVARPGDGVAVFGLGIVGSMASQVYQASGYEVAGVDPVATRRSRVEACGLRHTISPEGDIVEAWRSKLGATPCKLIIDTSGSERAVYAATQLAAIGAEIVLVGVAWKKHGDYTMSDLLQPVFTKYLHVRSGWEWEIPVFPANFARGSVLGNLQHAMSLIARGAVNPAPMRSHVLPPNDAESAYVGLLNEKERYQSVVLDWSRLAILA